jgi:hypothetical protein
MKYLTLWYVDTVLLLMMRVLTLMILMTTWYWWYISVLFCWNDHYAWIFNWWYLMTVIVCWWYWLLLLFEVLLILILSCYSDWACVIPLITTDMIQWCLPFDIRDDGHYCWLVVTLHSAVRDWWLFDIWCWLMCYLLSIYCLLTKYFSSTVFVFVSNVG